jgi:hypothetical protein
VPEAMDLDLMSAQGPQVSSECIGGASFRVVESELGLGLGWQRVCCLNNVIRCWTISSRTPTCLRNGFVVVDDAL